MKLPRSSRDSGDEALRKRDPAGVGVFFMLDEGKPEERALMDIAVLYPDAAIATDRFPLFLNGRVIAEDVWPLPKARTRILAESAALPEFLADTSASASSFHFRRQFANRLCCPLNCWRIQHQ
jgi:hypothetical protein